MKWKERVAAALLALMLLGPQAGQAGFSDTAGHWAEGTIEKWSSLGLITGNGGLFRPDAAITRGEMAVILDRLLEYPDGEAASFADLEEDAFYTAALSRVAAQGIIRGSGGQARPLEAVTRQEAAVMLARAFGVAAGGMPSFADAHRIAPWAAGSVAALERAGILRGSNGRFDPAASATRAQVIHMIESIMTKAPVWGDSIPPIRESIDYYGKSVPVQRGVPLSRLDPQGFFMENGLPAYEDSRGNRAALGIDVSAWQKDIDWAAVKAAGIAFAMLRVGGRGYGSGEIYEDTWFRANVKGASENGIDIGVYFFSQAINEAEAVAEAEFVLKALEGHTIAYPVCFDWEWIENDAARTDHVTGTAATAAAKAFCERVAAAGYRPSVYLYTETALFHYDLAQLTAYELWFARYSDTPDFYYNFHMWQFTSGGTVPGIAGGCDMNLYFAP